MNKLKFVVCLGLIVIASYSSSCKHAAVGVQGGNMAQGSLSVLNMSTDAIYPVVLTKQEEDFGGVSAGAVAMIGFVSIEAAKIVRVSWAEGRSAPRKVALFSMKLGEGVISKTKHLEFRYLGNDVWELGLYSQPPEGEKYKLATIKGEVQK